MERLLNWHGTTCALNCIPASQSESSIQTDHRIMKIMLFIKISNSFCFVKQSKQAIVNKSEKSQLLNSWKFCCIWQLCGQKQAIRDSLILLVNVRLDCCLFLFCFFRFNNICIYILLLHFELVVEPFLYYIYSSIS